MGLLQAGWDIELRVISFAKIRSSMTPNSWSICSGHSDIRAVSSVLLALA